MSKNTIANSAPSRSLVLAVGSAAAVFGGLHETAAANADAELIAACASILKADAEYGEACVADENHPDLDRLFEEQRAGTDSVSLIPAKTMAGVKAKASVLALWLPHSGIEKSRLTDSLVADILAL